ncbi:hypothetical protein PCE1_004126 [Barthelona sp. PCE]
MGKTTTQSPLVVWAWISTWMFLNIGITLLNKAIFRFMDCRFPVLLTCVHCLCSGGLATLLKFLFPDKFPRKKLSKKGNKLMLWFSLLFASNIAVGNSSLAQISVSLTQTIRATTPVFAVVMSFFILKKNMNPRAKPALVILIVGMIIACYGEMNANGWGMFFAIFGVILSALKAVMAHKFLAGEYKLHPIDLVSRMGLYSLVWLFPYSLITESKKVLVLSATENAGLAWRMIFTSGVIAFFLNISNFIVNQQTSPVTLTVCGNLKQLLTIILSVFIFQNVITWVNGFGILITLVGAGIYSYYEVNRKLTELMLKENNLLEKVPLEDIDRIDLMEEGQLHDIEDELTETAPIVNITKSKND